MQAGARTTRKTIAPNPGLAAAIMVLASAFVAGTTLLAKGLGGGTFGPAMHPLQITFGRFLFAWIALICLLPFLRPDFVRPAWSLHVARTLAGWSGVTLMFTAVIFIPLADATAISFLNPVFAMVFAVLLLGEKTGPVRWVAAAIALSGAIILLRPGASSFQPAALMALTAAAVLGFEITIIKRLSRNEPPLQILLINNSFGLLVAGFAAFWVWQAPTAEQWAAMAGIGFLMAAAQACYINALARADTGFVIPFSYMTLVFAALYDFAIFGAQPDIVSLLGIAVILLGAGLLALRQARAGT